MRLDAAATAGDLMRLLDRQEALLAEAGLGEAVRLRVRLLSEEILSNAVRHGAATHLEVHMEREADTLCLGFVDDAGCFDPARAALPDAATPLPSRRPGGLGLLLVRQLADGLDYRREAHGNRLDVRVDLSATEPYP